MEPRPLLDLGSHVLLGPDVTRDRGGPGRVQSTRVGRPADTVKDLGLLRVDPEVRLTAEQARRPPFFECCEGSQLRNLAPHQRLRVAVWTVLAAGSAARSPPHGLDSCAFRLDGPWVKKGEQQSRAALFQHSPLGLFLSAALKRRGLHCRRRG
ncbi:Phosphorylase b kinase gamma catalytic chain, testis/liver isoform [Heterocephalus glaber]|uniref:Phosphorylase b kinase gamma catalytic chain, testis/liver isoform n=1 Tax=Heterocephalus glaber TaxID=10181 RepID=G5AN37_HETGA|nr:Phosphorylase b kinase gamma catalytic chain, testis/liver isoform [Heterocephalus glaber]